MYQIKQERKATSHHYIECQSLPSKILFEINLEKVYLDVLEQKILEAGFISLAKRR